MTDNSKQYEERNAMALGEYYGRHVHAMTVESLHAKSDIAAELGYRDKRIDELLAALEEKDQRIAELEQRLQQPIKLPPLMPEDIFAMTPQRHMVANAHNNAITACSMSIRDAGFKSECTVWKEAKGE